MHLVHWTLAVKRDTDMTVFLVVCGFPKCREGEVPLQLFLTPTSYIGDIYTDRTKVFEQHG